MKRVTTRSGPIVAIACTLFGMWIALSWGWRTGRIPFLEPILEFRLPDGHRGPFVILVDPNGETVESSFGRYVLSIPECGVLRIRDDAILRTPAVWQTRSRSGQTIPDENLATAGEVALRSHGFVWRSQQVDERFEFYVGKLADSDAFEFGAWATPDCDQE